MEKITFTPDGEEAPVEFFVVEQTRLAGISYLLVTDQEDGDAQALILRDMSEDDDPESVYEIVSDDEELEAVSDVFESMLDDVEFVDDDE